MFIKLILTNPLRKNGQGSTNTCTHTHVQTHTHTHTHTCMHMHTHPHNNDTCFSLPLLIGPLDYVQITEEEDLLRPFETDNSTHVQCFNVTIRDDTEFEQRERFSIHLSLDGSIYQSVVVEPSVSVVEIVDNDGELPW